MAEQRREAGQAALGAISPHAESPGNRACQEMHMRLAEVQAAEQARNN